MFREWLITDKGFTDRSAADAQSRLNRIKKIIGSDTMPENMLELLEANEVFKKMTICVKSQLRRTIKIYSEYLSNTKTPKE